ncbi:MAG TPA: 3-hydroxyacyl-ACP dehydratase [Bacteroidales bacterium]|jgi:3-hydroxyacyl-[acyl-carrier-protein] dehydratase|nr:3-hydroxyacyl-ACP dehydratase [Bacteroidales bacterium]HNR41455.1 3-hydroxyacyl-ACP dehydratase [Bacteroidales bacterium]HPM17804.1 3-hydroxyacyl-ACP dehydratase [Bacteroidales bacterium]HQG77134.1 3-hydroxyacyl-ACP dehydratase [Bacteroidales bacterium]
MRNTDKLQGDLYTVQHTAQGKGEGAAAFRIAVNPDHEIFLGHFPGNPVLPGACTIQILKELAEGASGRDLLLSGAQNIKFLSFIDPRKNPVLDIDLLLRETEEGTYACSASVHYGGRVFCSFRGTMMLLPGNRTGA